MGLIELTRQVYHKCNLEIWIGSSASREIGENENVVKITEQKCNIVQNTKDLCNIDLGEVNRPDCSCAKTSCTVTVIYCNPTTVETVNTSYDTLPW